MIHGNAPSALTARNSANDSGTSSSGKCRSRTTFSTWLSTTVYQTKPGVAPPRRDTTRRPGSRARPRPATADADRPSESAGEREREGEREERADEPERILGERGERESGAAHEEPARRPRVLTERSASPRRAEPASADEPREPPLNRRDEERLRADVAAEDDEERRREERARRREARPRPEETRAQQRGAGGGAARRRQRRDPRGPLPLPERREGARISQ